MRLLARGRVRAPARPGDVPHAVGRRAARAAAAGEHGEQRYVERFLVANHIHDEIGIKLDTGGTGVALIGVLGDGRRPFGPRDVARLELLTGPLSSILRFFTRAERSAAERPALSPREREVAELVAGGLTNREIARTLCIGEPTVKNDVSRALAATGCSSRTQLAITWRG